jgi:glycosyltransferase involved in cell wall biosynthesis
MNEKPKEDSVSFSGLKIKPYFSIIITTYNRRNILKRALDSLILQTENDWEAIIVDDESTDDTRSVILPYLIANKGIRYFVKSHSGEAMSKNEGINLTSGRFVSFLDSDDEYGPEHLGLRKVILTQNPSVSFLYGGVKVIGNQFVPDRFNPEKRIHLSECVIGGTFFIDRDTLLRLKGFRNIQLGTDSDFFERAMIAGVVMKETEIPTYIYHHETEDSITNMLLSKTTETETLFNEINPVN